MVVQKGNPLKNAWGDVLYAVLCDVGRGIRGKRLGNAP